MRHHAPKPQKQAERSPGSGRNPKQGATMGDRTTGPHYPGKEKIIHANLRRINSRAADDLRRTPAKEATVRNHPPGRQHSVCPRKHEGRDHQTGTHERRPYGHPCHDRQAAMAVLLSQIKGQSGRLREGMQDMPAEAAGEPTTNTC